MLAILENSMKYMLQIVFYIELYHRRISYEKLKICLEIAKLLCFLLRLVVDMRDQIIKSSKIR